MELILEASLSEIRIVLAEEETILWSAVELDGRAELVESLLQRGVEEIKKKTTEISRILVSRGPGSFTGLRVALAYAQGLAFPSAFSEDQKVTLHLATTFELLALAAEKRGLMGSGTIILPARRGWYYGAGVQINSEDPLPQIEWEQMVAEEQLPSSLSQSGEWSLLPKKLSELPTLQTIFDSSQNTPWFFNRNDLLIDAAVGKINLFPQGDPLRGFPPNYIEKAQAKPAAIPAPTLLRMEAAQKNRNEIIRQIAAIELELFDDHWSEKTIGDLLPRPMVILIIALDRGEKVVGYLISQMVGDELELWRIAVTPKNRRRGIAKSLLQKEEALFAAHLKEKEIVTGAEWLEVRSDNEVAQQFYLSVGFVEEGRRKNYYGHGIDGLMMKRPLQASAYS